MSRLDKRRSKNGARPGDDRLHTGQLHFSDASPRARADRYACRSSERFYEECLFAFPGNMRARNIVKRAQRSKRISVTASSAC